MFFTNGIVGLRSSDGARALDKRDWQRDTSFMDFCREFFVYQIEVLKPRLVVILGPTAKSTLLSFVRITSENGNIFRASIGTHTTLCLCTSHPYGDFNFPDRRKASDAVALSAAWALHL
jgi:uracil-DNA glycosylase family 4